jgi:hypothetical protein
MDEEKRDGRRPEKPLAKPVGKHYTDMPVITDPEGSRRPGVRRLASIASIALILAFVIYLLRFGIASVISPKMYVSLAAVNTIKGFSRELLTMTANNAVLKKAFSLIKEPSDQTLSLYVESLGGRTEFELTNDNKRNQLQLFAATPLSTFSFYLSDSVAGLRIGDGIYSFDPESANEDVDAYFAANDLAGLEAPANLNISYAMLKRALTSGYVGSISPDFEEIRIRYMKLLKKLYDSGKFKNAPKEKLSLGGATVSCKVVSMQISRDNVEKWLNELADTIGADSELRKVFGDSVAKWESSVRQLALFYNGSLKVTLLSYNNRFIEARLFNEESNTQMSLSTLGKDYRLDNISFSSMGRRRFSFQAIGNHIGPGDFRTNIHAAAMGPLAKLDEMQIVWQSEKKGSNLLVGSSSKVLAQNTLSIVGDSVVFISPNGYGGVEYTLSPMKTRPEWPDNAKPIWGLRLSDFKELFEREDESEAGNSLSP